MHSAEKREKKKLSEARKKKLQAQTKIIKIKAKNKHNKILNSNNCEARKKRRNITQILHYPLARSLAPSSKSARCFYFFFCVAKVLIFFSSRKKSSFDAPQESRKIPSDFGVIFHVEKKEKSDEKSYFSFVIKYFFLLITFSINIFHIERRQGGEE